MGIILIDIVSFFSLTLLLDASTSQVIDEDLSDAVLKLAKKYVEARTEISQLELSKTSSTSLSSHKVKELEETVTQLQQEINDVKTQRNALEKRLETSKQCSKSSKEEITELTLQIDSLKHQNQLNFQEYIVCFHPVNN